MHGAPPPRKLEACALPLTPDPLDLCFCLDMSVMDTMMLSAEAAA